jgi:2-polyprenyl-3-methyl-5-hydroxy-6-metoxy-1,4-benzoquinol methylase
MLKKKAGSDPESTLRLAYNSLFSHEDVSDEQISQAWDQIADKWADRYSEHGDMNREFIIDPAIFRIIGTINNLSILDAGCGGGYLSRLLAKKGAHVTGVDISKRFIEIARQKENQNSLGVTYHVGSLSNLLMCQNESFDLIVSNVVLADVKDLKKAIKEFARVLKPNGKLVFSDLHPCFATAPVHGWAKVPQDSDRTEDWIFWKMDKYFDRSVEAWRYHDWPQVYGFHRPLSDYMNLLFENGFVVTDFEEPIPSTKAVKEHFRDFSDGERIPWFLVIGAKKDKPVSDAKKEKI